MTITTEQTAAERTVSLVIPGRNCARTIRPCLDAVVPLLGRHGLDEIIFVDDASNDDTAELVQDYSDVTYLQGDGGGRGAARNLGSRAARNPLVWFIDSDCVAEPDALELLLPHFDAEEVAGVGGSYGNMRPDSLLACLIHEEIISHHLRMPREVNFLATFNVVYRRSVLEQVGGFSNLARGQDAELAYRVHDAGYQLRFEAASRVRHFHPTNWRRYMLTQARQGYSRVLLYAMYPNRAKGDSYSGFVDHVQPPLAMLTLASLPLLIWPILRLVPLILLLLLALAQLPMTLRTFRRVKKPRYLMFAVMSFVRAYFRGFGMSLGFLAAFRRKHKQAVFSTEQVPTS